MRKLRFLTRKEKKMFFYLQPKNGESLGKSFTRFWPSRRANVNIFILGLYQMRISLLWKKRLLIESSSFVESLYLFVCLADVCILFVIFNPSRPGRWKISATFEGKAVEAVEIRKLADLFYQQDEISIYPLNDLRYNGNWIITWRSKGSSRPLDCVTFC